MMAFIAGITSKYVFVFLLFLLSIYQQPTNCQRTEWDANNFPNPTAGDIARCNMRMAALICDPDQALSDSDRNRINHELQQLESRTRQNDGPDFCKKKGITGAMAVVKHARGGSIEAVKNMANDILKKWRLDDQCEKAVVYVVALEDKHFWVARASRVPVYGSELNQIFADQKQLFESGEYSRGLMNVVQQVWQKALSKQSGAPGGGTETDRSHPGGKIPSTFDKGDKSHGLPKLPSIPYWVWLAILFVVIPLICCCCLCYCCFCRGKNQSPARRQGPADMGDGTMGMGGNQGPRRGLGGGFNNILGGLGGAGIGSLAGKLLSGGGGGRRGQEVNSGGMDMGGYHPSGPPYPSAYGADTGGRGLYPSNAVQDEGGGGSWGRR